MWMKHEKFIERWKKNKEGGFKRYLISTALVWTLIMFPFFRILHWYFNNKYPFNYSNLWWELPMCFMSGISCALIIWIVNNYLYAKYRGKFTPENHHDHE